MQNFSIKPVLWDYKKNKAEIYTIKLMITVDRKASYIRTSYKVHKNQFDKERRIVVQHPNAQMYNVAISRQVADLEKEFVTYAIQGVKLSKKIIKGEGEQARSFYSYAKEVRYDKREITRLKNFTGDDLLLSNITVEWLRKYEDHERRRAMSQNTLNTTFKYISRIIRQAKKEKLISENPFDEFAIPKYKQTNRVYLTEEEIKLILNKLDELPADLYTIACYFLLGCYTGLRHSDWRRFNYEEMIEGGFIKLRAKKNNSHVVVPIGKTLSKILHRIKGIPAAPTNQECNRELKAIATICGIKRKVTTHVGRHTAGYMFATHGLPEATAAALLGISAQTVKVYYHLSGKTILKHAEILKSL